MVASDVSAAAPWHRRGERPGALRVPDSAIERTMSSAPTPAHRGIALGRLQLTLTAIAVLLLAAILGMLLVDRIFYSSSTPAGTGSGVASTQARSVAPFTGVDLAGSNNVIVRVGARRSVVVHADSNLLSRVTTRRTIGPARDRDHARQPQRQEPDVRGGHPALSEGPHAARGRKPRRLGDQQPTPRRQPPGERPHPRDRTHDAARRDARRLGHSHAGPAHRG